jgi:hypothetical protein
MRRRNTTQFLGIFCVEDFRVTTKVNNIFPTLTIMLQKWNTNLAHSRKVLLLHDYILKVNFKKTVI